jgi:hypothetical protein
MTIKHLDYESSYTRKQDELQEMEETKSQATRNGRQRNGMEGETDLQQGEDVFGHSIRCIGCRVRLTQESLHL